MALVKCRECGKSISSEAKACPSCGIADPAPYKPNIGRGRLILFGIALITVFAVLGRFTGGPPDAGKEAGAKPASPASATAAPKDPQREADFQRALLLVLAVKKGMNDPSSLEVSEAYASDTAVAIEYRGKNSFGALVVNYAILTKDGKIASGTKESIASLWNKHVAKRPLIDLTASVQGAKALGVY